MQHVSTYNSHLEAKLRTVNDLQGGCAHYFMYGEKPQQKHCKPYGIPNAHNQPVKH